MENGVAGGSILLFETGHKSENRKEASTCYAKIIGTLR